MNVLLTCAGRRNYLLEYFKNALGGNGFVFAADSSLAAPAMQQADKSFVVPSVSHPDYVNFLLEICASNNVHLVVSLNDLELPVISAARHRFPEGCTPIVSSPEVIGTCFDKWETYQFLIRNGIPAPKTFLTLDEARDALRAGVIQFPVVLKPRWGTASIGIDYPDDDKELELAYSLIEKRIFKSIIREASSQDPGRAILIQEKLNGKEFGLDVINDLNGRHVFTSCKQKLAMRAGETDRAVTVDNPRLRDVGQKIGSALGHIGNLDCDVFEENGNYYVLELNPRFGGGYPFSYAAGVDLPKALILWAQGHSDVSDCFQFRPGIASAKCDILVMIKKLTD